MKNWNFWDSLKHYQPILFTLALFGLLQLITTKGWSQEWRGTLMVGDKAAALYPFSSAFDNTFHPTAQFATEYHPNIKENGTFFISAVLHFHNHRLLGKGIGIRLETGYRFDVHKRLYSEVMFGIGVLSTTPSHQQYELNASDVYEKSNSQILTFDSPLTLGMGYKTKSDWNPFFRYQYSVQFPFNKTIPILPSDQVFLGCNFPIAKK